ncbi:MAG TPA: TonB-dependent receptor plug domain-containing protein, partial [Rhodocyclaceae bacterium]|nr:TonB-dependent receptor plug domain-containing protein [Rhodocyclaceae bacterium]
MPAHCPIRTPNPPASALVPLGALLFGFSLPTAAAESAPTLAPVIVTDRQDVIDASNSYQGQTTTVCKLKQLPKDIPQALTIVTEKLMEDRGQSTLKDALSNVAGLTFNAGEGGRIG